MKAVCIPVKDRPSKLRQLVIGLDKAGLFDLEYRLFIGIEPGDETVNRLCMEYPSLGMVYNRSIRGIGWNHYNIIQYAFLMGAEQVTILDADLIVSPDILRLCDWFYSRRDEYYGLGLLSPRLEDGYPIIPDGIVEVSFVSRYAMVYGRQSWFKYAQPGWMKNSDDWDASREVDIFYTYKKVLAPVMSRIQHVGCIDSSRLSEREHRAIMEGDIFYSGNQPDLAYNISKPDGEVVRR